MAAPHVEPVDPDVEQDEEDLRIGGGSSAWNNIFVWVFQMLYRLALRTDPTTVPQLTTGDMLHGIYGDNNELQSYGLQIMYEERLIALGYFHEIQNWQIALLRRTYTGLTSPDSPFSYLFAPRLEPVLRLFQRLSIYFVGSPTQEENQESLFIRLGVIMLRNGVEINEDMTTGGAFPQFLRMTLFHLLGVCFYIVLDDSNMNFFLEDGAHVHVDDDNPCGCCIFAALFGRLISGRQTLAELLDPQNGDLVLRDMIEEAGLDPQNLTIEQVLRTLFFYWPAHVLPNEPLLPRGVACDLARGPHLDIDYMPCNALLNTIRHTGLAEMISAICATLGHPIDALNGPA